MADIKNFTDTIKNATLGEEVRDAFIEILKILNRLGGSVSSLDGHEESYFATDAEMRDIIDAINKVIDFSEEGKPSSDPKDKTLLTSGCIYDAIEAVDTVLEDINNNELPVNDLLKNIKQVKKAKKAILDAIRSQDPGGWGTKEVEWYDPKPDGGVKVKGRKSKTNFRDFATYINNLNGSGTVTMQRLSIDENKIKEIKKKNPNDTIVTITADEENWDSDQSHKYAYNEIVTNIKHNTRSYNARYNEVLNATGDLVGYDKITVNTSDTSVGSGRSGGKNGSNKVDENGIIDTYEITSNTSYLSASETGCNGWRTVYVNVQDLEINYDATYTVNFYDSDGSGNQTTLLDTVEGVPYNGNALYTKEPPSLSGLYFAGWDPPSSKIRRNTDCVAVYTQHAPAVEEIPDPWETIISNCGRNYAVGSYKSLLLNNGYGNIKMQKVAVGEDASSSTWVAMDILNDKVLFDGKPNGSNRTGWSVSGLRTWLNGFFFTSILPEVIRDAIVDVTKYSYEYDWLTHTKYMSSVKDKIWIPSLREILGDISNSEYENLAEDYYTKWAYAINNTGVVGGDSTPSTSYESWANEYRGLHYDQIYPDSHYDKTYGLSSGNLNTYSRVPTDLSKCIKNRNGSPDSWGVRTLTTVNTGAYNQNATIMNMFEFRSDGTLSPDKWSEGSHPNLGSSAIGVVIGFCL